MFVVKATGREGVSPFETKVMPIGFPSKERAQEYLQKAYIGEWEVCNLSGVLTLFNKRNHYLYEIVEIKEMMK